MRAPPQIEIREPGHRPRRLAVDRALEFGRECDGAVLRDEGVSRRHLKLLPSPLGLSVVDLGSRNGTRVNGIPLQRRTSLNDGDVIRLGRTELLVLAPAEEPDVLAAPRARVVSRNAVAPLPVPPPPAPVVAEPSRPRSTLRALFMGSDDGPFRTYLELPRRIPIRAWQVVRIGSVAAYLALC